MVRCQITQKPSTSMAASLVKILSSTPGIDRDGTTFDSTAYTDGVWCRFYRGVPRKIGGYIVLNDGNDSIIRSMGLVPISIQGNGTVRIFLGQGNALKLMDISKGVPVNFEDVTPSTTNAGGFVANNNNLWKFESMTVNATAASPAGQVSNYIFAFVAPNAQDAASAVQGTGGAGNTQGNTTNVFWQLQTVTGVAKTIANFKPLCVTTPAKPLVNSAGDAAAPPNTPPAGSSSNVLTPISGGIVSAGPFLFAYGNNGLVQWSSPGNPFEFPLNQVATISGSKIVAGIQTRGGGATSVLFWSLTDVILAQYSPTSVPVPNAAQTGGISQSQNIVTNTFSFDTIRDDVSIISSNCIVEYNDSFFWIGIDQFYVYNGTVSTLPNSMNRHYFFDGVNKSELGKVWGMSVPQFDEIWWFYPRGANTECSDVIIYNVALNVWYDVVLARSAGIRTSALLTPLMADSGLVVPEDYVKYPIWAHEYGVNRVYTNGDEQTPLSIPSSFTTAIFNLASENPEMDANILTRRVEPDFAQTYTSAIEAFVNPMSFDVISRPYANSPPKTLVDKDGRSAPLPFDRTTPYLSIQAQGGLVQYKFMSDVIDGSYQMGKILLTYSPGNPRRG